MLTLRPGDATKVGAVLDIVDEDLLLVVDEAGTDDSEDISED